MKTISFLIFLSISFTVYSQTMSEEELRVMLTTAQDECVGAHESIVLRTNEELAKSIWGKPIRFNDANVIRFFNHSAGEAVTGGVDINMTKTKTWGYAYDQKAIADLLMANGIRVTESYRKLWINARQDILYAESIKDEHKTILELYCPSQELLQMIRTGRPQSIEFLVTGFWASPTTDVKINGVLTKVNTEKQVIKCSNGHEYDKVIGYKFCPKCGEPLK